MDMRTREMAATLLGVATTHHRRARENSGPHEKCSGEVLSKDVGASTAPCSMPTTNTPSPIQALAQAGAFPGSNSLQETRSQDMQETRSQAIGDSLPSAHSAVAAPARSSAKLSPSAGGRQCHDQHIMETKRPANSITSHSGTEVTSGSDTSSFLSMSSIGFGIDSSASASWGDATEACMRALQDAMERSTLRLPMATSAHNSLQIRVQIGVPPKFPGSNEIMSLDIHRLKSTLPKGVPVLPLTTTLGGLFIKGEADSSPSICTAVACITLQTKPLISRSQEARKHCLQEDCPNTTSDKYVSSHIETPKRRTQPPNDSTVDSTRSAAFLNGSNMNTKKQSLGVNRNNSIEVLAMISEEIRLAVENGSSTSSDSSFVARSNVPSGQHNRVPTKGVIGSHCAVEEKSLPGVPEHALALNEDAQMRNGNGTYNYQKLPPGLTMKNNRRLFVKHSYQDYSSEKPAQQEQDSLGFSVTPVGRTQNAAFPLKLHETLSQIEEDGHGSIIGWLPHGRSFKIHKQKEFAEIILPRYFVMTKKSSFLRQLNLYGFNRFSAGPDQGSYYHEKFLRGMKFLCRQMVRQKVNGNRIRSAGNPDEEPVLSSYPSCPPRSSLLGQSVHNAADYQGMRGNIASSSEISDDGANDYAMLIVHRKEHSGDLG